jgi:hypothetical protein
MKNYVYVGIIRDLIHLKARIREAVEQAIRDATACVARSRIFIRHEQGHESCTYEKLLIVFKTIGNTLYNKILISGVCFQFL